MSDPHADTVLVPRPFVGYRCQRTMVCCHEPYAATVDLEDEARLRAALAESPEGRVVLETLSETIIGALGEPDQREWAKHGGRCKHLVVDGDDSRRGCGLHHIVGLTNLASACRNFPRLVQSVDDHWEVAFQLGCPTAAKALAADPAPMTIVSLPRADWPYLPRGTATVTPERRALRDAWWAATARSRGSASEVLALIGAMLEAPDAPPTGPVSELPASLEKPISPLAAMVVVQGLLMLPERGLSYAGEAADVTNELVGPWSVKRLIAAAEPGPELVAAFLDHQVNQIIVFTKLAPEMIVRMGARRALAILRVVDALCDRVPFRSRVLFADAFTACSRVNPDLGREPPTVAGPPDAAPEVRND
ncbi:MAG: hypothetical protein IT385_11820 [Deltaproteobacteria bacterium]|nr:hypothetical protein [Deltaproteobacteria bacterium]